MLWDKSTQRCDECETISERKMFAGFASGKSSTVLDNVKIDTENGESLISIAIFIIIIIVARRELKQSRTFMCASLVSTFYHVSRNESHVSEPKTKNTKTHTRTQMRLLFLFQMNRLKFAIESPKTATNASHFSVSVRLYSQFGKDNLVACAPWCDSFVQHSKLIRKYVVWVLSNMAITSFTYSCYLACDNKHKTSVLGVAYTFGVAERSCDHRSNQRFAWLSRLPTSNNFRRGELFRRRESTFSGRDGSTNQLAQPILKPTYLFCDL